MVLQGTRIPFSTPFYHWSLSPPDIWVVVFQEVWHLIHWASVTQLHISQSIWRQLIARRLRHHLLHRRIEPNRPPPIATLQRQCRPIHQPRQHGQQQSECQQRLQLTNQQQQPEVHNSSKTLLILLFRHLYLVPIGYLKPDIFRYFFYN